MAKVIICPFYGAGFSNIKAHRFDAELIRIIEEKEKLIPGARGNPAKRKDLDAQLQLRLQELKINIEPSELVIHQLASGKRFKIEEYDGAEYIITEDDLDMVAP
jgi:hypothetical protein